MNKDFIPYEEAVALKEIGFNEPCPAYYHTNKELKRVSDGWFNEECVAPLYQQAFGWFRDRHHIDGWICPDYSGNVKRINAVVYCWNVDMANHNESNGGFHTYEEAQLSCLKKLIEIVKNTNE